MFRIEELQSTQTLVFRELQNNLIKGSGTFYLPVAITTRETPEDIVGGEEGSWRG